MRFAIASQNFRTVTGHAGRTRRFLVFEVQPGEIPREVGRLDLDRTQTMHEFDGQGAHALDQVQVVIAGSVGGCFVGKMAERGIRALATSESDPVRAIELFLAGTLPPPGVDDHDHDHAEGEGGCNCGHAHAALASPA